MASPTIIVQGIIAFIAIGAILSIPKSIIQIESGKVGIVYRAGKLQETLLNPGFGVKIPYVDSVEQISLSFLTERVKDIPCGTNGGVTIYFELIEVVHRLKRPKVIETVANYSISYAQTWIVDRLHHEINQFCSTSSLQDIYISKFDQIDENLLVQLRKVLNIWAPGIELISIRVTKPIISDKLMAHYSEISNQQTQQLIRKQQRRTILKKVENDGAVKIQKAVKEFDVAKVNMKQQEDEAKKQVEIEMIADKMHVAREKQKADSLQYKIEKEAESNLKKLTPEFLEYIKIKSFSNNLVIVHGDSVPGYIMNP